MFVSVFICRLGHSDDGLCLPVALCSDWSFFLLDQVNTHTHTLIPIPILLLLLIIIITVIIMIIMAVVGACIGVVFVCQKLCHELTFLSSFEATILCYTFRLWLFYLNILIWLKI